MTKQQHPITPPLELVKLWISEFVLSEYECGTPATLHTISEKRLFQLLTRGAQWGADQELEACCEWLIADGCPGRVHSLRAARRPNPPSLKEQAIEDLEQIDGHAVDQLSAYVIHGDLKRRVSNIRRALEALPDD